MTQKRLLPACASKPPADFSSKLVQALAQDALEEILSLYLGNARELRMDLGST